MSKSELARINHGQRHRFKQYQYHSTRILSFQKLNTTNVIYLNRIIRSSEMRYSNQNAE